MKEQPADIQPVIEGAQLKVRLPVEVPPESLSTRLKRRGLLTGLAALGAAALVKLSGADKAEAHDVDDVLLGGTNNPSTPTSLVAAPGFTDNSIVFKVNATAATSVGSVSGIQSFGHGPSGYGVEGRGGSGPAAHGLSGVGGDSAGAANAGAGTFSLGGTAQGSGTGGTGLHGQGGGSGTGPFGTGVLGESTGLAAFGVRGVNGANGTGVKGVSNGSGLVADGDGAGIGVHGRSSTGIGVKGEGVGATGIGVQGLSGGSGDGVSGSSITGKGVHGQSAGFGVYGLSTGNTPSASAGVFGGASNAPGVQGYSATSIAVHGFCSDVGLGVYGQSLVNYAVVAESNTNVALYALSKVANAAAVYGQNSFVGPGKLAGRFDGDVVVNGNFTVSGGAKAAAVTMADGSKRMMYCQESPEPFFEDFGRAQISGGAARVNLEPMFASLVHLDDYHVFLTPEGDTDGLFVSGQDAGGFTVREVRGGKGSFAFSYRVVAKRKDIAGGRLALVATDGTKTLVAPVAPPIPQNALTPNPSVITPAQPVPVTPGGSTEPGVPAGPKGR